jgi:integrase
MEKIMTAVSEMPKTKDSIRLKAILSLLALQGLRQVEIVRLDVKDLDLVSKTAFVLGKGRDDKEQKTYTRDC